MSPTQGFTNFFFSTDSYRIQRWVISNRPPSSRISWDLPWGIAGTVEVPTAISMSEWPHGTPSAIKVKQHRMYLTLCWRAVPHVQLALLQTAAFIELFYLSWWNGSMGHVLAAQNSLHELRVPVTTLPWARSLLEYSFREWKAGFASNPVQHFFS